MEIRFDGNIGKDAILSKVGEPENQYFRCYFWVAENIDKRNGNKKTLWHKVTIWRGYAEKMAEWLKSGRHVLVEGNGEAKMYTRDTQVIPYIDVQATKIRLLDNKKADEELPPDEEPAEEGTPWDDVND